MKTSIIAVRHPEYSANHLNWVKYRETFVGGKAFVDKHLKKYSIREDQTDFNTRLEISYCAAHAKAGIIDIKNSIYQRLSEISRNGGSESYINTVQGLNRGIDLEGRTMTNFIGTQILPELLALGKVGLFVDRPIFSENPSLAETKIKHPYLYSYKAEDILSWSKIENQFTTLLLRDYINLYDDYGLVMGIDVQYRLLTLERGSVVVQIFDKDGKEQLAESDVLKIPVIPFVVGDLSQSLLTDVADYQIALTNLESSDIGYSLKSNFPFYVEQFNAAIENIKKIQTEVDTETGEPARENVSDEGKEEVKTGIAQGRRYPQGLDQPAFIHPSSEPLIASMKKQDQLKQDIRKLINLSLRNLERPSGSQSADESDEESLEAGLSYIGLELEKIENEIGRIWGYYEGGNKEDLIIKYPRKYSLKTDKQRREEASDLNKLKQTIPSGTAQKELTKQVARILLEDKATPEIIKTVESEIDAAKVLVTDHEILRDDFEKGLVSGKTASKAAGYPEGDFEQAKTDHVERVAEIAEAQAKIANRGVADLQNPEDGKLDKIGKDGRGASNNE
jgi:hypothetical protein